MKPVLVELSKLKPDPKNARKHDRRNIEAIKQSLMLNEQYRPFVVQKKTNRICIGNGMYFHIWDNMPLSGYLLIGLTDYAVKVGQEVVFLPLTKKVVAFWKRYDGMDEYDTGEMRTYNPFRV